jgi:hypothetical protein
MFELAGITYIYWPIECTSKTEFAQLFETTIIIYIYWPIECTPKPLFE